MAWKNYQHLRLVRGLTGPEFRVLSFLEEEANLYGAIEALRSKAIATECEIASNSVFRILRALQRKKFISSRTNRFRPPTDKQVSNAYQLDLARFFPAGETIGAKYWKAILKELGELASSHAENSEAFYSVKTKNLTVWLDGGRDLDYFDRFKRQQLLTIGRGHTPRIRYFDFLVKIPLRIVN